MRNYLLSNLKKRMLAGTCAFFIVVSCMCLFGANVAETQAADKVHVEQLQVDSYRKNTFTAPKPTEAAYADWLFAGWYEEETCETALTDEINTGKYYAKFVPADVLSIRCQIPFDTTKESTGTSKLRIVSTVDSLAYSNVGFKLKVGTKVTDYNTKNVYTSIKATEGGVPFDYAPTDFDSMSQYFVTVTVTDIANKHFSTGICITPYWVTLDGTEVSGVTRYGRVEDGYLNIVNIPVRLHTDAEVAGGMLAVQYDEATYSFYGWDAGTIFGEMKVAKVSEEVRCVGNSEIITNSEGDVKADGMYVNLRFQLKDGVTMPDTNTFSILDENFCDSAEQLVDVVVSDAIYKSMK